MQIKSEPLCFPPRMHSPGQGSSGRRAASGCDPPIPCDQGRCAHSCTAARGAAPRALQAAPALHSPALHSPALRSPPPGTVRKMEANARGAPTAASLCALRAAGLPQGPPRGVPSTRGMPRLESWRPTLEPATAFLPHSAPPPHVPSGPPGWAGGPRRRRPASRGRTHSWSGRAKRPPRPPPLPLLPEGAHDAANPNPPFGCFTNPQPASARRARPLQVAYGGRRFFLRCRRAGHLGVRGAGVHRDPRG